MFERNGQCILKFENKDAYYQYAISSAYTEPFVGAYPKDGVTLEDADVKYNKDAEADREEYEKLKTPLTFEILSNGVITWNLSSSFKIQYQKNESPWSEVSGNFTVNVEEGDEIRLRAKNISYYGVPMSCTARFNVRGNIMSLIDYDNIENASFTNVDCVGALFSGCTNLISAEELLLPAKTLTLRCYANMFRGCTNLIKAPTLLATTIGDYSCTGMFEGCTSLTLPPELPAENLGLHCYTSMFWGCTSLTTAPELPAKGLLPEECYSYMFAGCTNLKTGPSCVGSPSASMGSSACTNMFVGCTSLSKAPELPMNELSSACYYNMFSGCTNLQNAPELPALTLTNYCYYGMFRDCTNLNFIKCLATSIPSWSCTSDWVSGVQTTSGTFIKNSAMSSWSTGTSGIPNNWTVQDAA